MFTRTTLALATIAAIGAALATSTSSADAGGYGRGHFTKPYHHGHFHRHHGHHGHGYHYAYRPYVYGVGAAAVAAPYAAKIAPKSCLTKEYTADNLVVFKDLCTKEVVAAPVGGAPQAAAQPPAGPQPGEIDPRDPGATK